MNKLGFLLALVILAPGVVAEQEENSQGDILTLAAADTVAFLDWNTQDEGKQVSTEQTKRLVKRTQTLNDKVNALLEDKINQKLLNSLEF